MIDKETGIEIVEQYIDDRLDYSEQLLRKDARYIELAKKCNMYYMDLKKYLTPRLI